MRRSCNTSKSEAADPNRRGDNTTLHQISTAAQSAISTPNPDLQSVEQPSSSQRVSNTSARRQATQKAPASDRKRKKLTAAQRRERALISGFKKRRRRKARVVPPRTTTKGQKEESGTFTNKPATTRNDGLSESSRSPEFEDSRTPASSQSGTSEPLSTSHMYTSADSTKRDPLILQRPDYLQLESSSLPSDSIYQKAPELKTVVDSLRHCILSDTSARRSSTGLHVQRATVSQNNECIEMEHVHEEEKTEYMDTGSLMKKKAAPLKKRSESKKATQSESAIRKTNTCEENVSDVPRATLVRETPSAYHRELSAGIPVSVSLEQIACTYPKKTVLREMKGTASQKVQQKTTPPEPAKHQTSAAYEIALPQTSEKSATVVEAEIASAEPTQKSTQPIAKHSASAAPTTEGLESIRPDVCIQETTITEQPQKTALSTLVSKFLKHFAPTVSGTEQEQKGAQSTTLSEITKHYTPSISNAQKSAQLTISPEVAEYCESSEFNARRLCKRAALVRSLPEATSDNVLIRMQQAIPFPFSRVPPSVSCRPLPVQFPQIFLTGNFPAEAYSPVIQWPASGAHVSRSLCVPEPEMAQTFMPTTTKSVQRWQDGEFIPMERMAQNAQNQQFTAMMNNLEFMKKKVRELQDEVMQVHNKLTGIDIASYPGEEKTIEERLKRIDQIYNEIEAYAHQLPDRTIMTPQMRRLTDFLDEASIDLEARDLYKETAEMTQWAETASQLAQSFAEQLRPIVGVRRRSLMTERPISSSSFTEESNPQLIFEKTLDVVLKENKKSGLLARYLEKSSTSAIIEFKYGSYFEKQHVCTLKMLMVVNNGIPDQVLIYAPHEDWHYLDGLVDDQVDINKPSQFEVYRRMTIQANIHLVSSITSCFDIRNPHTLSFTLEFFSKFANVFQQKCRVCKKIMRDFLPPLIIDMRSSTVMHESCR